MMKKSWAERASCWDSLETAISELDTLVLRLAAGQFGFGKRLAMEMESTPKVRSSEK